MIRRVVKLVIGSAVLLFVISMSGAVWIVSLAVALVLGWWRFLDRALREATFDGVEVVAGCALVGLIAVGFHLSVRAFQRAGAGDSARAWRPVSSAACVGMLVLLFAASLSLIGVVHQLTWVARTDPPMLVRAPGRAYPRWSQLCALLAQERRSAGVLRTVLWRDPRLRDEARALHIVMRDRPDGTLAVAIFPRDPLDLEREGGVLCDGREEDRFPADRLEQTLDERGFRVH